MSKEMSFQDWTNYITKMSARTTLTDKTIKIDRGVFASVSGHKMPLHLTIIVGSNIHKIQNAVDRMTVVEPDFLHYNNVSDPIKFERHGLGQYVIAVNSFEVMERILNDSTKKDKGEVLTDIIDLNINDLIEDVIAYHMPLEARDQSLDRNILIDQLKSKITKNIIKALNL